MPDSVSVPNADFPEPMEALGESDRFLEFQDMLSRVAKVERPVLLMGERGTGKELAAKRLHFLSKRWDGPFVAVDCSALTPSLIESELFGYEAGAFTGAARRREGRFERADGGTLFLDELGNVPLEVQAKILRVVEYGTFERVGGSERVQIDVRIVGATNADLVKKSREGEFMPDLLDRLSFEVLNLPPLRVRQGDIEHLAQHFAARMALELGEPDVVEFSDRALETLLKHDWPGNVRELKNVVERSVFRADGGMIDEIVLDPFAVDWDGNAADKTGLQEKDSGSKSGSADLGFKETIQKIELEALREALHATQYKQTKAAERMGLSYHQFRGLYRKYQDALETST